MAATRADSIAIGLTKAPDDAGAAERDATVAGLRCVNSDGAGIDVLFRAPDGLTVIAEHPHDTPAYAGDVKGRVPISSASLDQPGGSWSGKRALA